VDETENLI